MAFLNEPTDSFGFALESVDPSSLALQANDRRNVPASRRSKDNASRQPNTKIAASKRCCRTIADLFGAESGTRAVFGTQKDLYLLNKAIQTQGLYFEVPKDAQGFHLDLIDAFEHSVQTMARRGDLPARYHAEFVDYMTTAPARLGCAPIEALQTWLPGPTFRDQPFYTQLGLVTGHFPKGSKHYDVRVVGRASGAQQSVIIWIYQWSEFSGPNGETLVKHCPVSSQDAWIPGPLQAPSESPASQPASLTPPPARRAKRLRQDSEASQIGYGRLPQREQDPLNYDQHNPHPHASPPPPTPAPSSFALTNLLDNILDPALFALPPDKISNRIMLYLSTRYTNTEIFEHINAFNPPELRLRDMNVITKRKTTAIKMQAKRAGVAETTVREELKRVQMERGVRRGRGRKAEKILGAAERGGGEDCIEGVEEEVVVTEGQRETQVALETRFAGGGQAVDDVEGDVAFRQAGGMVEGDGIVDPSLLNDQREAPVEEDSDYMWRPMDEHDFELFGDLRTME